MKRVMLGLVAGLATIGAGAAAQAATISYSGWFPLPNGPTPADFPQTFDPTDWNGVLQSITLPQFNPSIGILTGVTLGLYGEVNSVGSITAVNDIQINSYTASMLLRLLAPGTSVPATSVTPYILQVSPTLISITDVTLPAGFTIPFAVTGSTDTGSTGVGTAGYIGTGSLTFPLFTKVNTLSDIDGGNAILDQATDARAELTITYEYSARFIPEPVSMALLGAGLVALGVVRRRR